MIDQNVPLAIVADPTVLRVCVCGEHQGSYLPLGQLKNAHIVLYYVDKDSGDIKAWNGENEPRLPK